MKASDRAADIVSGIKQHGGRGFALQADGADSRANRALFAHAVEQLGDLDILVNNAGTIRHCNIVDLSEDDIDALFHLNIRLTVLTTKAGIGHMGEGGRVDCR